MHEQKGKALFHPIRLALTGAPEGVELDLAVPAIEQGAVLAGEVTGLVPIRSARERAAEFARCVAAALVFTTLAGLAGLASGQRLNNGTLSCSAVPPSGGQSMSQALLSNLTNTQVGDPLNTAWGMQAPKHIDPLTPTIPQIKIGCVNPELNTYCTFNVNGGNCYDVYADVSMDNVQNLSQLQFKSLTVTSSNFKDIAAHSNRGPDARRITSGIVAAVFSRSFSASTRICPVSLTGSVALLSSTHDPSVCA